MLFWGRGNQEGAAAGEKEEEEREKEGRKRGRKGDREGRVREVFPFGRQFQQ